MSTNRDQQTCLHNVQFFFISSIISAFFSILIRYRLLFSTATVIFSIKNWLCFSSVLIRPISSFTFDECLILIFWAFKDSIKLLNLQSRYFEFLFVSKLFFSLYSRENAGRNCFMYPSKLWWYEIRFGIYCFVSSCCTNKKLQKFSFLLKLS